MSCDITQQLLQQTGTLNSIHENLSKVAATFRIRCKQYFLVKLWKHTKNCTDIFYGWIEILGTQVFLRMDGNRKQVFSGLSVPIIKSLSYMMVMMMIWWYWYVVLHLFVFDYCPSSASFVHNHVGMFSSAYSSPVYVGWHRKKWNVHAYVDMLNCSFCNSFRSLQLCAVMFNTFSCSCSRTVDMLL